MNFKENEIFSVQEIRNNSNTGKIKISKDNGNDEEIKEVNEIENNKANKNFTLKIKDAETKDKKNDKKKKKKFFCNIL